MASEQSLANKAYWEAAAQQGPLAPEATIERVDIRWTPLSTEPGGIDYLEVDTGGLRPMWVWPKGAADDRVIFYAHGGFVSGSIYTHRKMVGHLAKAVDCRALLFEYPYAHEQKYPPQLNATVAAYRWLLGDMALSAPSFETNRETDAFFTREAVGWLASNFLGTATRATLLQARYTPASRDFRLPSGGRRRGLARRKPHVRGKGKTGRRRRPARCVSRDAPSFQMMAGRAPEADDAIQRLADWVRPKLGIDPVARKGT